ncbi:uncharacterized protein Bfra_007063 [Botrytis fragariae]|uniref:F-box domain-containing protein n=1 Tax=Botrytis fragariae TaxID=1964551 RepID=A0A8H6AIH4_9HELO|nr:uncharacterized protein Bfra_007063 [Botrytis fragariae]KAF5867868.1 hypothetical protein Bfra_007063 [Botrytis fragariae]
MGAQISSEKYFSSKFGKIKNVLHSSFRSRATKQSDSKLERLPAEILLKIMRFLIVSDVSIAFTCPRMYVMFKDVFPRPISLCNAGVTPHIDHLDALKVKKLHSKLIKYAPMLRIYKPKDYIYRVVTRVCKPSRYDMELGFLFRYEHYGRFLRRPYYDNEENYRDLKDKYLNYELFAHCWAETMEGVFTYPYPHNKGRVIYEMEMKQEIHRLLDSMDDATPKQYILREFFMKEFLAIGTYIEVKDLVIANLSLIYFSQWREMSDF